MQASNSTSCIYKQRKCFTLVETVVVICILSLLASGGMLMLSATLKRANEESQAAQIEDMDKWCRLHSQVSPVRMMIDLSKHVIAAKKDPYTGLAQPPRPAAIERLILGGASFDSGSVDISYDEGVSKSFAVLTNSRSRQKQWLFFCGPTGQVKVFSDENGVEKNIATWLAMWADTD